MPGEGFLLDGYPADRSPRPRRWRGSSATPDGTSIAVLLVDVPEDELVARATLLRGAGGRPRKTVVRERLRVYREKTAPLIGYYRERGLLREIDGNRPVEEVTARMLDLFGAAAGPGGVG